MEYTKDGPSFENFLGAVASLKAAVGGDLKVLDSIEGLAEFMTLTREVHDEFNGKNSGVNPFERRENDSKMHRFARMITSTAKMLGYKEFQLPGLVELCSSFYLLGWLHGQEHSSNSNMLRAIISADVDAEDVNPKED